MANIDLFNTRSLMQAVEMMKPARSFMRDTFFGTQETFLTESVDIDITKGARRLAPFVHPRIGSKTVDSLGYETRTFTPPQVGPDFYLTGQDLQKRLPGENIYSGKSPDARLAALIAGKLAEADTMITRREEWMCTKAVFTGQIPIIGDGYNVTVDYQVTNKTTISTAKDKWSYVAADYTGNPIDNLKAWKRAILKASGVNPDRCVMSPDAADAFMKHPAVLDYFADRPMIQRGNLAPNAGENGVYYIGYLAEIGLDLYSYEEFYIDNTDGVEKALVPAGTVVLTSTTAGFKMLYGAVVDVERGTFAQARVPDSWIEKKPKARVLQLLSRPLPAITLPDAMYIATVL